MVTQIKNSVPEIRRLGHRWRRFHAKCLPKETVNDYGNMQFFQVFFSLSSHWNLARLTSETAYCGIVSKFEYRVTLDSPNIPTLYFQHSQYSCSLFSFSTLPHVVCIMLKYPIKLSRSPPAARSKTWVWPCCMERTLRAFPSSSPCVSLAMGMLLKPSEHPTTCLEAC